MSPIALLALCIAPLAAPSPSAPQDLPDRHEVVRGKLGRELDDYLTRCAAFGFSGCVLVEVRGKLALCKGYGVADPQSGALNTCETLYDIASASKQVTAAAILKLESLGKLSTSDPVRKYLPEMPKADGDVTIDHLLHHTSGYPRMGPSGGGADLGGAVHSYTSRGRTAEPGERFEYWNGGYALLAGVVERVGEQPYEDWVTEHLFAPAGLRNTRFIHTEYGPEPEREPEEEPAADPRLARTHDDGERLTTEYIGGWGYHGMGGVLTSISDLRLWVNALLTTERILPDGTRAKMLTPGLGDYACGWYVLETKRKTRCVQHGGTAPGFQTYIRSFIDEDTLTLVVCNREGMHWQVAWGLEALLFDETPKVPFPPEISPLKARTLAKLVGTWRGAPSGRLKISGDGPSLLVRAQGSGATAALNGSRASHPGAHAWERERAREIMEEIIKGESASLTAVVEERIPKSWPGRVATDIWPAHVKTWGALVGMRDLGVIEGRTGVQVLIALDHEHGERAVKIVFHNQRLGILDLNAGAYPVSRHYAQVSRKRFESYAFSAVSYPALEWDGKGIRTIDGIEFRRVR